MNPPHYICYMYDRIKIQKPGELLSQYLKFNFSEIFQILGYCAVFHFKRPRVSSLIDAATDLLSCI